MSEDKNQLHKHPSGNQSQRINNERNDNSQIQEENPAHISHNEITHSAAKQSEKFHQHLQQKPQPVQDTANNNEVKPSSIQQQKLGNLCQEDPKIPIRQSQQGQNNQALNKMQKQISSQSMPNQTSNIKKNQQKIKQETPIKQKLEQQKVQGQEKEGEKQDQEESQNDEDDYSNIRTEKQDDNKSSLSGEGQNRKEEAGGRKCFNKLCPSKKFYRKIRSKVEHAKYRFLCKPCYESYCNNDFCEFCEQIYSSTGNTEDDDQWIGCDQCNRWNHIECEKKYRNKNIHDIKDQESPYLCLTCSCKAKNAGTQGKQRSKRQFPEDRILKTKPQINKEQRMPIFNRKIENLPSLEYFLQNYNFRLWLNQNLIKQDIQTLRAAEKKAGLEDTKKNKKVKLE